MSQASESEEAEPGRAASPSEELTEEERAQVEKLAKRDREVRAHEQAHRVAGGRYAGAAQYSRTMGPDGKTYVTGGEVSISVSEVPGDPQATIVKMEVVKRAALAPAQPSSQDRAVHAQASRIEQEARAELLREQAEASEPREASPEARADLSP
jgi:hypothetical protein